MGEHYSPQEIEEGLSGRLPTEKSREILRHLLRGCSGSAKPRPRRERRFPPGLWGLLSPAGGERRLQRRP